MFFCPFRPYKVVISSICSTNGSTSSVVCTIVAKCAHVPKLSMHVVNDRLLEIV